MHRTVRMGMLTGALLLAIAGQALADAAPPADAIIGRLAVQRERIATVEAVFRLDALGETSEATGARASLFFRAPDTVRLNISWPDREEIFLAAGQSTMAMIGDQARDAPWPQPFLLYRFLIVSGADEIADSLTGMGVDLTVTSMGPEDRFWIIGAAPHEEDRPQAWIETDNLRLTRLFLPEKPNAPGFDILLSAYARHVHGVFWPHRLHITRVEGGRQVSTQVLDLQDITIQPAGAAVEESEEASGPRSGPAPEPPLDDRYPELNDIRKMMEWLDRKLEQ